MGWEDIIAIMDANEKDALARKRGAMLDGCCRGSGWNLKVA
jgi:hypothetical protein